MNDSERLDVLEAALVELALDSYAIPIQNGTLRGKPSLARLCSNLRERQTRPAPQGETR